MAKYRLKIDVADLKAGLIADTSKTRDGKIIFATTYEENLTHLPNTYFSFIPEMASLAVIQGFIEKIED